MGKGFEAVYSPKEEKTAPNGLPLDLSIFNKADYLCIRHKGINGYMWTKFIAIKVLAPSYEENLIIEF